MMDFITGVEEGSRGLQRCDIPEEERKIHPFVVVIFGGAGDLSKRKLLPTLYHIFREGELPESFHVIGAGMPAMEESEYTGLVQGALEHFDGAEIEGEDWSTFSGHLHYVSGELDDADTYSRLHRKMKGLDNECLDNVVFYLAVPPAVSPLIVEQLGAHKVCRAGEGAKIIIEKPFGSDLHTARALNATLRKVFREEHIYRIDHYLGKETVQNIIFFRFSNVFEHLWNSQHIDNVQITVAEDMGIAHRGAFYEQAGVVRDIIQNHMMQLIALVAMEPPIGFEPDFIRDEKVKVLRSIRPMTTEEMSRYTVRGQYGEGSVDGEHAVPYRKEASVDPQSGTTTPCRIHRRADVTASAATKVNLPAAFRRFTSSKSSISGCLG